MFVPNLEKNVSNNASSKATMPESKSHRRVPFLLKWRATLTSFTNDLNLKTQNVFVLVLMSMGPGNHETPGVTSADRPSTQCQNHTMEVETISNLTYTTKRDSMLRLIYRLHPSNTPLKYSGKKINHKSRRNNLKSFQLLQWNAHL